MKKSALFNIAAVSALALLSACGCGDKCEETKPDARHLAENTSADVADQVELDGNVPVEAIEAAPVMTQEEDIVPAQAEMPVEMPADEDAK